MASLRPANVFAALPPPHDRLAGLARGAQADFVAEVHAQRPQSGDLPRNGGRVVREAVALLETGQSRDRLAELEIYDQEPLEMPFQRARGRPPHGPVALFFVDDCGHGDASLQVASALRPRRVEARAVEERREVVRGGAHAQAPADSRQGFSEDLREPAERVPPRRRRAQPSRCAARARSSTSLTATSASSREIPKSPTAVSRNASSFPSGRQERRRPLARLSRNRSSLMCFKVTSASSPAFRSAGSCASDRLRHELPTPT